MKNLIKHNDVFYSLEKEIRIKKKKKYNKNEWARM
jgi:hypothetical protein